MGGRAPSAHQEPHSGAHIEGLYRYRLWRTLDSGPRARRLLFVMLNPSTADGEIDDATLRRCVGFAARWGYGSLEVCNLFAYRATDPAVLARVDDPIGPDNDVHLLAAAKRAGAVVAAWGTRGALHERASQVTTLLLRARPLLCLGLTKDGSPRHPLYVRRDAALLPFAARRRALVLRPCQQLLRPDVVAWDARGWRASSRNAAERESMRSLAQAADRPHLRKDDPCDMG